jgi:hypothetical protein
MALGVGGSDYLGAVVRTQYSGHAELRDVKESTLARTSFGDAECLDAGSAGCVVPPVTDCAGRTVHLYGRAQEPCGDAVPAPVRA